MKDLKPCPFCGGEAQTLRNGSWWFVACKSPFCCDMGMFDTEAEAIEAWNTRAELTCEFEWSLADNGWADHTCRRCGYTVNTDIHLSPGYNYCPNCGAKVVE